MAVFVPQFEPFNAALVPFTGWGGSMPYMFGTSMLLFPLLLIRRHPKHHLGLCSNLYGLLSVHVIYIIYGTVQFLTRFGRENFGNPYLTVSAWQPIWTMAIPVAWCLVFWWQLRTLKPSDENPPQ